MSAANNYMLLDPRVQTSVSLITQLKAKHGSFKVWCAGCFLALVIVTPIALWGAGVFDKTTPPLPQTPVEYVGYNSLTYPEYYTGGTYRQAWPMSGNTPGPAMQACGMINTPLYLINGQCAVFVFSGEDSYVCSPFVNSEDENDATPGCISGGTISGGNTPILVRSDSQIGFAATDTHIYPDIEGAIAIEVISDSDFADGDTISGASMPFEGLSNGPWAVVTTTLGGAMVKLDTGVFFWMTTEAGFAAMDSAHAAAVSDNSALATFAVLYSKGSNTHLEFYKKQSGLIPIEAFHSLEVFPNSIDATPNNADLAFDSTNSYVLVTLGPLFALVAVPKDGNPPEILHIENGLKAAFGPPPPEGGGVRPPQLYVVASDDYVHFTDASAKGSFRSDYLSVNVFFTSDGTAGGTREDFVTPEILGVEWSTLDEVIVYRKNSLQIVKVPDAVKAKYNGVKMETYESIYIIGASGQLGWPNEGVADFVSCTTVVDNRVEDCTVWTANNDKCYSSFCIVDDQEYSSDIWGNIVAHYFHDGRNLMAGSDNHIKFWEDGDLGSATNLLADGDNDVVITGASDWWQDGGNFYALITTASEVGIYDLTTGAEIINLLYEQGQLAPAAGLGWLGGAWGSVPISSEGNVVYAATATTINNINDLGTTTAAAVLFFSTSSGLMLLRIMQNVDATNPNHFVVRTLPYNDPVGALTINIDIFENGETGSNTSTLAFDTTKQFLLATFNNKYALVNADVQASIGGDRHYFIISKATATSNVQVAFSPSPTTFTTASGGTTAAGIFKQLYVVATKDKLEWFSVDQPGTLLASINSLNTPENDDIVSVQWLTQHEVVLFRSTSGRQHVPVPGKVFNVDRDDVADFVIDDGTCSAMDASLCSTYDVVCPVTCSSSVLDVDHYANQNQGLQKVLEYIHSIVTDDVGLESSTKLCTTIDCNIWDTTVVDDPDQLQNGALVAQFLCPETCKAPVPFGSKLHIHVSGACEGSGINGDYEYIESTQDENDSYEEGASAHYYNGNIRIDPSSNSLFINKVDGNLYIAEFDWSSVPGVVNDLPMGTRTWQVDCTPTDDTDNKTPWQVTIEGIPPPPP